MSILIAAIAILLWIAFVYVITLDPRSSMWADSVIHYFKRVRRGRREG